MFLTAANLAHYLFFRGLLTPDSVVGGDYVLIEAGRRHRNFRVKLAGAQGLFIKQSPAVNGDTAVTLQREATFYQLLRDRPAFARYARVAPRIVDYDPAALTLTVELLPDCENLTEYHLRVGGFPGEVAQLLGEEMGDYHASAGRILSEPLNRALLPHRLPWIFQADETTLQRPEYGPAGAQLSQLLRGYPELIPRTRELVPAWQFDCIVHGDLKWDNLLVRHAGPGGASLHVIDWELADAGDASWDVGSVLASYLSFWSWQAERSQQPPPELFRPAQDPRREPFRAALGRFWAGYSGTHGPAPASAGGYLVRCVRFCAARLVTTAYELLFNSPVAVESARSLLRLSDALLGDPRRFAEDYVTS